MNPDKWLILILFTLAALMVVSATMFGVMNRYYSSEKFKVAIERGLVQEEDEDGYGWHWVNPR